MIALSGLAGLIGLQLLSLVFVVCASRAGKLVIAASTIATALWLAADLALGGDVSGRKLCRGPVSQASMSTSEKRGDPMLLSYTSATYLNAAEIYASMGNAPQYFSPAI